LYIYIYIFIRIYLCIYSYIGILNVSTSNADGLSNDDELVHSTYTKSLSSNIDNTNDNIGNNTYTDKNTDTDIPNTSKITALQLLKLAYELYNLISKQIDDPILQKIKIIIINVFSFTGRYIKENENTKIVTNLNVLDNNIVVDVNDKSEKNADYNEDGMNSYVPSGRVEVNDTPDNEYRESNTSDKGSKKFGSIMGDCALMWSTKNLVGQKRKLNLKQQDSKQLLSQEVLKQQKQQPLQYQQQQQQQQPQLQQHVLITESETQDIISDVIDEHSDKITKISETIYL
jgi:hypothetical protein